MGLQLQTTPSCSSDWLAGCAGKARPSVASARRPASSRVVPESESEVANRPNSRAQHSTHSSTSTSSSSSDGYSAGRSTVDDDDEGAAMMAIEWVSSCCCCCCTGTRIFPAPITRAWVMGRRGEVAAQTAMSFFFCYVGFCVAGFSRPPLAGGDVGHSAAQRTRCT